MRKMGTTNEITPRQSTRSLIGALYSFFCQTPADFLGTPGAKFPQRGQALLQIIISAIHS